MKHYTAIQIQQETLPAIVFRLSAAGAMDASNPDNHVWTFADGSASIGSFGDCDEGDHGGALDMGHVTAWLQTGRAICFWQKVQERYPHARVAAWIDELGQGGEWFRNLSLANVALAAHCRIGRIGFDDAKYTHGQARIATFLAECGLTGMQD